jgi:hypothetical protein
MKDAASHEESEKKEGGRPAIHAGFIFAEFIFHE